MLTRIAAESSVDPSLREKLGSVDDGVLADVVLNLILSHHSIDAVVPAMMQQDHLARNVAAVTGSRFTGEEITLLRKRIFEAQS